MLRHPQKSKGYIKQYKKDLKINYFDLLFVFIIENIRVNRIDINVTVNHSKKYSQHKL